MAFNVIYGKVADSIKQSDFVACVKNYFEQTGDEGTLYLGYSLSSNIEEMRTSAALLIGKNCGVVAFDFPEKNLQKIYDGQDNLFGDLDYYFRMFPTLRSRRGIIFDFRVASIVPAVDFDFDEENYSIIATDSIAQFLSGGESLSDELYHKICEALQKITGMKPTKARENVTDSNSKGGKLKQIEAQIANLDAWQQKAAMEITDGPQRIRGLAGSGKTIILAWKAAYLHAQFPEWDVAVIFFSKSLYPQFKDLITRFHALHSRELVNWKKLHVLHSWGGKYQHGIYHSFAAPAAGIVPLTYKEAISKFGYDEIGNDKAFSGICDELLEKFTGEKPIFDAVLIDEAQDLPRSFFQIVYKLTKPPKRIIWAYDELQNISNVGIPTVENIFGTDGAKVIDFSLDNLDGEPMRDITLPVCYRNPLWSLAIAHALGFGIYRKPTGEISGIVQMFDEPEMWEDVGYQCVDGELALGEEITLKRRKNATPDYFEELLTSESSVQVQTFNNINEQYEWVANEISKNITEDELDPDDILVIFAAKNTNKLRKYEYPTLRDFLWAKKIDSIWAEGDNFRQVKHVTCSQIYRAKGNEAPMVYIVNADSCASSSIDLRNILFTAVTRSRAWVRILGVGDGMKIISDEINACIANDYQLKFKYPTQEELTKIRKLNFDKKKKNTRKKNRSDSGEKITEVLRKAVEQGSLTDEEINDWLHKDD